MNNVYGDDAMNNPALSGNVVTNSEIKRLEKEIEKHKEYMDLVVRARSMEFPKVDITFKEDGKENVFQMKLTDEMTNDLHNGFQKRIIEIEREIEEQKIIEIEAINGIKIKGHEGTWHILWKKYILGEIYFLLEHDEYGEDALHIAIDCNCNLILDEIEDGVEELEKYIFDLHV